MGSCNKLSRVHVPTRAKPSFAHIMDDIKAVIEYFLLLKFLIKCGYSIERRFPERGAVPSLAPVSFP